ncbi:MAG TPA: hypothetical protein VID48_14940 [Solirubrobacteraceae bacterium]
MNLLLLRIAANRARSVRSSALPAAPLCVCVLLVLLASGCGSASTTKTSPAPKTSPVLAPKSSARQRAIAPVRHLSIITPHTGAHTHSTVTVRVSLSAARSAGRARFRYVLDRHLTRSGSDRLTFHELRPGRHSLEVFWAAGNKAHATTTFTVRAPVAPASPPVKSQPTVATPIPPPTSATAPARTPPPRKTTAPAPPKASPPKSGGGIPQGPNAGDGDGDNSGGPSDGDGNL